MKDHNLPNRFFLLGHEPDQNNKVNDYLFPKYYKAIMKFLDRNPKEKDMVRDGFKVCSSAQFLHYLLSRQLHTTNPNEIWIVFGGKPFRFSLREFVVATGLKGSNLPTDSEVADEIDGEECEKVGGEERGSLDNAPYWTELFDSEDEFSAKHICKKLRSKKLDATKKLKLSCLMLVDILLLPTSGDVKTTYSHIRMIKDLDVFLQYPWGRDCFALVIKSIKARKEGSFCKKSMAIQGFIHGLQLVAQACIPEIISFATTESNNPKKEILQLSGSEDDSDNEEPEKPLQITMRLIKTLDKEHPVNVAYTLPLDGTERDDFTLSNEFNDKQVSHMLELLQNNQKFTIASWSGGIDATNVSHVVKEENVNVDRGKPKGKKVKNDKGQASDHTSDLTMTMVQDLIDSSAASYCNNMQDTLKHFEAKFSGLLKSQSAAIKKDLETMSTKIDGLSHQVDVIKSQQCGNNKANAAKDSEHTQTVVPMAANDHGGLPNQCTLKERLNMDAMGNVKDVLAIVGAPTAPTFSLGLTQDGVPSMRTVVEETSDVGDQLIQNFVRKQRTKRKFPTVLQNTNIHAAKQLKPSSTASHSRNIVSKVDESMFQMLLMSIESVRLVHQTISTFKNIYYVDS